MQARMASRVPHDHEHVTVNDKAEVLEIIREEQCSPPMSAIFPHHAMREESLEDQVNIETPETENKPPVTVTAAVDVDTCCACVCEEKQTNEKKITEKDIEILLAEKEKQLSEEFEDRLKQEISMLTDRFDFILRNEQTRASYMLTEAYRERQEKVMALQTQLECKNLAGVMYVMCSERRRSKLEKLRIIEEYTNYIKGLINILGEGQAVILDLSNGYKTAAKVDHEWRQKMKKVVTEFQNFVYHFAGGTPESNQYFFDLPNLLKTEASLQDNSEEEPICNCEEETITPEPISAKTWCEQLDSESRPFIVYGDMAEFQAPQRREVLKNIKAVKTAPKIWKEYVFHDMSVYSKCPNADSIKDEFENRIPLPAWGDFYHTHLADDDEISARDVPMDPCNRRVTTASIDVRGMMGSLLKIITQSGLTPPVTKATLLGAKDSMEITSTTKLREKSRQSVGVTIEKNATRASSIASKVDRINFGTRRTSFFKGSSYYDFDDDELLEATPVNKEEPRERIIQDESSTMAYSALGKAHTDSLEIIDNHVPDQDHKLHYEKLCPMDKCKRMHMDSFVRSLPPYMRTNPFTHFESNYEEYETCSPAQLDILKRRIEERKKKERAVKKIESPTAEWNVIEGVGVQTSELSVDLPPCTCRDPNVSPASSVGGVFRLEDLIPVKQNLDEIKKECFYDSEIDFNRFKVLGQKSGSSISQLKPVYNDATKSDFTRSRLQDIKNILKKHPSLCDIFQANTRC